MIRDKFPLDGIQEVAGGGLRIPSFTDPAKSYTAHPESGYCSCPRHTITGQCDKHVELSRAVVGCRTLRFGSKIAERRVIELAHRVYAPVRRSECFVRSYELLIETLASRHATEGMARAAFRRHGRVLLLHDYGKVA